MSDVEDGEFTDPEDAAEMDDEWNIKFNKFIMLIIHINIPSGISFLPKSSTI